MLFLEMWLDLDLVIIQWKTPSSDSLRMMARGFERNAIEALTS